MDLYEGVNVLLGSIGEIPITDDTQAQEAEATSDIGLARDTLLRMSKIIQQEGYWFNEEKAYPMIPNTDGYIAISNSILSIYHATIIVKDHKLYDTEDRTYQFEEAQELDVVFEVPFDDLPYVVADVITREATLAYYNNVLGDTQELRILEKNAQRAQVALQKAQLKHRKANLMSGSKLLNRTQNPTGLV